MTAQNGKVNPGVVAFKFGWKKNQGSKPEPPPGRDRIPASKVRETVSTEKHIHDMMDCSPINIVFWLGTLAYLAAMLTISFGMSFPSQRYWLLPAAASWLILFFIFYVILYVVFAGPRAATPCPKVGAAAANAVTTPLLSRPSPPLPISVTAA